MSKKVCGYLCKGCGIGDALDLGGLKKAAGEQGVKEFKEHDVLCSPEGVAMIQADVDGGTNALLIAACSSRAKTDEFS